IIKMDPAARTTPGKPFPTASWGDSDKLNAGDTVFAMGSPLAMSQSITQGIVSTKALIIPFANDNAGFLLDGERVASVVRWIGHDSFIAPGYSGGPLVNMKGEIVGINEIGNGLAGAIPGNLARHVAEQLIKDGKAGWCWTGMEIQQRLRSGTAKSG